MTFNERIYNKCIADGIPSPLAVLIVAQANHETDGFTSKVFTSCNNCFGYKYVGQSLSTGACTISPELDYYAAYANIEDSTHEITQWIRRRQRDGSFPQDLTTIVTPENYAQLLHNAGFYGDTVANYTNGLIFWLTRITNLVTPGTGLVILLLLGLGILAYRKKLFK